MQHEIDDRIAAYCYASGTSGKQPAAVSPERHREEQRMAQEEARVQGQLREKERQLAALEAEQTQLGLGSMGRGKEQVPPPLFPTRFAVRALCSLTSRASVCDRRTSLRQRCKTRRSRAEG